jgi:hypothetical protein
MGIIYFHCTNHQCCFFSSRCFIFLCATQSGPDVTAEETWGVNYRSLNDLFGISQTRADSVKYDVKVQMIEIYNEQVRDLLMTDGANKRYPFMNNKLHLDFDKGNNLNENCKTYVSHIVNVYFSCISSVFCESLNTLEIS